VQPEGKIPVRLLTPGRLDAGTLIDLNNVGAFVATDLDLEKGTEVHLELEIPGVDTSTPFKAVVARRSEEIQGKKETIPAGLGLVFVGNTPEERDVIQQVVMSLLTLDLLSFGCKLQRIKHNSKTLPLGVKVPKALSASEDSSLGSG
jgi:hypothetical protein